VTLRGEVTLRPAVAADLPRLPGVEDAAGELFREVGMPEVAEMPALDVDSLRNAEAEGLLWVADSAVDGPVGFALAECFDGSMHLAELSVHPAHGRRGIGAGLVECVARAAVERGFSELTLSTFVDVPWNAPYYRRLGFTEIDEAALPAELRAVRAREESVGLAIELRTIMRRLLPPKSKGGEGEA